MSKSFAGVAYWSGADLPQSWGELARDRLEPIKALGGDLQHGVSNQEEKLKIGFDGHSVVVLITQGRTQGIVTQGPASALLLVCLVALKKLIGGIQVVDDGQQEVPTKIRQNYELFKRDWQRVEAIAQSLSLIGNQHLAAKYGSLMSQVF